MSVEVAGGGRLTEVLHQQRLLLNIRCGQRGLCNGCRIELLRGQVVDVGSGERIAAPANVRACQCRLDSDAAIRVPARSLMAHRPQIVSEFRLNVPRAHNPLAPAGVGAAVDIGTTTVAVLLADLSDGRILRYATAYNKQMQLADDVATRISLCGSDSAMVGRFQQLVVEETILPLLGEEAARLAACTVAGNTTMLHLFLGTDPTPLGTYPFRPRFLEHRVVKLPAFGGAEVHLLPGAAAYIGADITAGILASGLAYDSGPSLLVDVGTNGEIILKCGGRFLGCATAAGPAFEGAGLSNG
ncbi:MAG: ASKHA domain-containing protein, partial [Verrucomicrobiae bacterium]|nr:ASKHA domain-containing protein [Verrucomicrobiae bacterium]